MAAARKVTPGVEASPITAAERQELGKLIRQLADIPWEDIEREFDKARTTGETITEEIILQRLRRPASKPRRKKTATSVYRSRPTNGRRRIKADMEGIREAISHLLAEDNPMTVRQVFYGLVTAKVIAKTEMEYK